MKAIKFTDLELDSMIEMYKAELEYAQNKVANIQEILRKLGAKPEKEVVAEKEPKQGKKRGPKPKVKTFEIKERKKPGRKPKEVVPTVEAPVVVAKPVKKEKVAKVKTEKTPDVKPTPVKKKTKITPEPSVESVPVAAEMANTKAPKPKKEKVAKIKADKPIKKAEKVAATVESVVSSLLTTAPKKDVAKVVKKKAPKKRTKGFVRLAPLGKPLGKKVVDEPAPIEPIAPAEQS
jgi:hypothetical protein